MLAIRDLSKTYANGVQALKNVTLDIPNGMFGLLGPNGAGKSTLMRTIATLQDPDSGSIQLDELDVLGNKQIARQNLGYLPQEFGVYPKVTAEAMLDHFAVLKGVTARAERKALVEALLRQVNLWDVRKRKLGTYSGGMRQRFGIAQALIGKPKLIIVDEPTAGLDPEERKRFLNLLAEIGENVVVILSTHIVEDVTDLCPRMAIISQGQVLLSGEPREAIRASRVAYGGATVPGGALEDYRQRMTVLSTRLAGGKTILHVFADTRPEDGFDSVAPDLEDVYFGQLRQPSRRRTRSLKPRIAMFSEILAFRAASATEEPVVLDDRVRVRRTGFRRGWLGQHPDRRRHRQRASQRAARRHQFARLLHRARHVPDRGVRGRRRLARFRSRHGGTVLRHADVALARIWAGASRPATWPRSACSSSLRSASCSACSCPGWIPNVSDRRASPVMPTVSPSSYCRTCSSSPRSCSCSPR